jgi:diadenosine tetraphosphate (Ap4A) HIT family hydrolase
MTYESPFLKNRERLIENEYGFVIYDKFPVTEGHCLIIPHRIYSDYFDTTPEEMNGLHKLILGAKIKLDQSLKPSGYNIGINIGEAAGQTVDHVHIHLIPRSKGDVDDPRGGVRGVIPSKQKY